MKLRLVIFAITFITNGKTGLEVRHITTLWDDLSLELSDEKMRMKNDIPRREISKSVKLDDLGG